MAAPLYELALLSAADAAPARRGHDGPASSTPEDAPLALFGAGPRASSPRSSWRAAASRSSRPPAPWRAGDGPARARATGAVSTPSTSSRCRGSLGRRIEGVPRDEEDFIPIDEHARVTGLPHVYAAGDVANFPVKHGGLAAQQADAAADAMLAELGLPIAPRPFDPVIQGVLFTGDEPAYLRQLAGRAAVGRRAAHSLWWPPSKIAGRHLATHLVTRAGLPPIPEASDGEGGIPVTVDARDLVRGVRAVVGSDSVPPG